MDRTQDADAAAQGYGAELSSLLARIEDLRADLDIDAALRDVLVTELESAHEEMRVADEEVRAQHDEIERLLSGRDSERWGHERLIAIVPVPVVVTDHRGIVDFANAAAAELLGTHLDRLLRKPILLFLEGQDRRDLRTWMTIQEHANGAFEGLVTVLSRRGGSTRCALTVTRTWRSSDLHPALTWLLLPESVGRGGAAPPRRSVATAFSELTQLPLHSSHPEDVLRKVASVCGEVLGADVAVSVSVGPPANPSHLASDAQLAQTIDGAQMVADEGPCQLAWETGEPVRTDDLRADPRWPRLTSRLDGVEVGGAIAVPVQVGDEVAGALNVYGPAGVTFGDDQVGVLRILGTTVAAILHEMRQKGELEALAHQLREALESRAVIDQAKGIIMGRQGCDADEAFRILAKTSSEANIKLRVVARHLVERASQGRRS